jgi:HlyD family secretion protein
MKAKLKNFLGSKLVIILVVVLVIIVIFSSIHKTNGNYDFYTVERGDFVNVTEVSGKVTPVQEIDLGFNVGGRLESVYVSSGDEVTRGTVLARLDASSIGGEINEAVANLRSEEVRLDEISGSSQNQNQLLSVKNSLISTLKKAYVSGDDVVRNTVDTFIEDPDTLTPEFHVSLYAYISGISSARTTIAGLIVDINSATEAVRDVEAEKTILQASINSANATVNKLSVKSSDYVISAPFDGVVTESDLEVGSVVSSGEVVVSMVGNNEFEIESFIPEVSIAGVDVGDSAEIIFDAFGPDEVFRAVVSHIDPRETIKDGITTYGVILELVDTNDYVLSGMNVEIKVEKEKLSDQIVIPRYLIQTDEQGRFVQKSVNGNKKDLARVSVDLGKKDSSGNVIIESGVDVGDEIVVPK